MDEALVVTVIGSSEKLLDPKADNPETQSGYWIAKPKMLKLHLSLRLALSGASARFVC
ncbi:MAG: hypothetical protein OXN96_07120 [Bryobacterales bacterium]|nr:hypothetical protein [Bryobacterales bacterium]